MPRARRGGPSSTLKSAVTKGVTSSKSTRGKKTGGLLGKIKGLVGKKAVPNRGSSRADATKARAAAQAGRKAGRVQRGPKETPLKGGRAKMGGTANKRVPKLKPKKPGFKRIKGGIITRRAGG